MPNVAVSSGVKDCTSAIWAAGTRRMPTCGGIRATAFKSAPAIAQWTHLPPARGRQDSRRTAIAANIAAAHRANRMATNSSGDRSRSPVFDAMNAELQSRTNMNGTRRTTMPAGLLNFGAVRKLPA